MAEDREGDGGGQPDHLNEGSHFSINVAPHPRTGEERVHIVITHVEDGRVVNRLGWFCSANMADLYARELARNAAYLRQQEQLRRSNDPPSDRRL